VITGIYSKLDDVGKELTKLSGFFETLSPILQGNGNPGLMTRLALLETKLGEHDKERKAIRDAQRRAFWGAVAALVMAGITSGCVILAACAFVVYTFARAKGAA